MECMPGESTTQIVETALKELEDGVFWNDVRNAFARSAADPEESAHQDAEIQTWERISDQDFRGETW